MSVVFLLGILLGGKNLEVKGEESHTRPDQNMVRWD